ncbi:Uncharacterised protein [Klebsiella pneumoniae]|uniref:Uncharacterized protein n=1 Tax=Klebsiella pneumoniae TaxID=573 RepID=A0A377XGB7_KLEPN|nr:Uncharacterised protein [Klebsiella pneumoniae]STU90766.1 Uncharacterised protein [Klebsiella pneumoniae]
MMKVLCGAVLSALLLAAGQVGRRLPVARLGAV